MYPEEVPTKCLYPGQVGYVACNMKQSSEGRSVVGFHIRDEMLTAIRSTYR